MIKAVFFDRDNTINKFEHKGTPGKPETYNYLLSWDDFEFLPGVVDGMKLIFEEGLSLIVVSNQSCVDKGIVEYEEIAYIFEEMDAELGRQGVILDGYYFCPHDPDGELPCACHKPKPGLLYSAAFDNDICLEQSWMVGDRITDMKAAMNAGIARDHIILVGKRVPWEADAATAGVLKVPNLYQAALHIVEAES
jgi:D-glycero-D-manno-heptose 1,7-bisphosphate phosphatase